MGRILRKAKVRAAETSAEGASGQLSNASALDEPESRVDMSDEEIDELDGTLSEVDASLETDSEEATTTPSLYDKTEFPSDGNASSVIPADVSPPPPASQPAPMRMTRKQHAETEKAAKHAVVREETDAQPSSPSNDGNQGLRIFHPGDGVTPILLKSSHHSGSGAAQSVQVMPASVIVPSDNMRMTRNAARLANISVAEPVTPAPTMTKRKSRILQQRSAKYKTFDLGGSKDETAETSTAATAAKKTSIPKPSKVTKTVVNKRQGRSATELTTVSEEAEDTPTSVVVEETEKAVDHPAPVLPSKGRKTRMTKNPPALNVFEDANSTLASTDAGVEPKQPTTSKKPSTASGTGPVHLEKGNDTENAKGTSTTKKPAGRGLTARKVNESDNLNKNTADERTTRSRLKTTAPSPSPVANDTIQNPEPSNPFRRTRCRKAQVVNTSTEF